MMSVQPKCVRLHSLLRIALAQMRCEKAAVEQNLTEIERIIHEADTRHIDLVALPEMCIGGYADPTRYPSAIMTLDGSELT